MSGRKKSNHNNAPFRLKSENKHSHQWHFLYYTNELTPNVSAELKKFTPQCEEIFGKFPVSNNDIDNNLGLYIPYAKDVDLRMLWSEINDVFNQCIGRETREYEGFSTWYRILMRYDSELKKVDEIQEVYIENVKTCVDRGLSDNLDALKLEYAEAANIPTEQVTESNLCSWLRRTCYKWLQDNDEIYAKTIEIQRAKMEKLREFQNAFDNLIETLCLDKASLARSAFRAIWNGTGKLQMETSYYEDIPQEIIDEIKNRLGINPIFVKAYDGLHQVPDLFGNNIPPPKPFLYEEPYWIYHSFEKYEKEAIEAYREHLHSYFKIIEESFKKYGYKRPQGNSIKYERLKWLVLWNNSVFDYLWEIIQHIPEFYKVDINNLSQKEQTEDKLRKAFKGFERLDLPVRPFGIKRKK